MTKLHGYFRSSAAYRARIALNPKGIAYDNAFVSLALPAFDKARPEHRPDVE